MVKHFFEQSTPKSPAYEADLKLYLVNKPKPDNWLDIQLRMRGSSAVFLVLTADTCIYHAEGVKKTLDKNYLKPFFKKIEPGWSRAATRQEMVWLLIAEPALQNIVPKTYYKSLNAIPHKSAVEDTEILPGYCLI